MHRDVKPENLLLCGGAGGPRVRLADFGLAAHAGAGVRARVGTLDYTAPEARRPGARSMPAQGSTFSALTGWPRRLTCRDTTPPAARSPPGALVMYMAQPSSAHASGRKWLCMVWSGSGLPAPIVSADPRSTSASDATSHQTAAKLATMYALLACPWDSDTMMSPSPIDITEHCNSEHSLSVFPAGRTGVLDGTERRSHNHHTSRPGSYTRPISAGWQPLGHHHARGCRQEPARATNGCRHRYLPPSSHFSGRRHGVRLCTTCRCSPGRADPHTHIYAKIKE